MSELNTKCKKWMTAAQKRWQRKGGRSEEEEKKGRKGKRWRSNPALRNSGMTSRAQSMWRKTLGQDAKTVSRSQKPECSILVLRELNHSLDLKYWQCQSPVIKKETLKYVSSGINVEVCKTPDYKWTSHLWLFANALELRLSYRLKGCLAVPAAAVSSGCSIPIQQSLQTHLGDSRGLPTSLDPEPLREVQLKLLALLWPNPRCGNHLGCEPLDRTSGSLLSATLPFKCIILCFLKKKWGSVTNKQQSLLKTKIILHYQNIFISPTIAHTTLNFSKTRIETKNMDGR